MIVLSLALVAHNILAGGCPAASDLPDALEVTLPTPQASGGGADSADESEPSGSGTPATTTVIASVGTGPESLANTKWACYRAQSEADHTMGYVPNSDGSGWLPSPLPGELIARAEFGPTGEVQRVFDNAVYFPDILGTEAIPDGRVRPTPFPGMSYAAGSYGASIGDTFAFAATLNVWLGGARLGTAVASAYGTVDGDRLQGRFTFEVAMSVPGTPIGSGGSDEYEFYAVREE